MSAPILEDYIPELELAKELGRDYRSLYRWRQTGDGPPHLRIGHSVYYRRSAIRDWLLSLERGKRAAR